MRQFSVYSCSELEPEKIEPRHFQMTIARLQHRIDASLCEPRTFVGVGSAFFSLEHTTPVTSQYPAANN